MKIVWKKNPLESAIELESDLERENFRQRVELDAYRWGAVGAHFYLDGKHTSVDIQKALSDLEDVTDHERRKQHVDSHYEMYLAELGGVHGGDCTCLPCSCAKCQAEELLQINTIAGLGKHSAYKVDGAIRSDPTASTEQILARLASPDYSQPNDHYKGKERLWFECVPRWIAEARQAHDWLKKYYESHPEAALIV